ncbi:MAG: DUF58 domain-containing protein [Gammaproteobacteria bacterium]|nr:DUF58 domain-containing protein [Gammaproteobacteria bacterium]
MLLTARAYAYIAGVTLLGIFGLWYGGDAQALWRVPASALIVAWVSEGYTARRARLAVERRVPEAVHLGQTCTGHVELDNGGRRRLRVQLRQVWPAGVAGDDGVTECTVPAAGVHELAFSALPQRLGRIVLPPLYGRVLGYFGLAWWPRAWPAACELRVVPAALRGTERTPVTQREGAVAVSLAGRGGELLVLREYRPGDPLRAIDWKASARSGRLTVRELSQDQHLELMLLIDAGKTSGLQAGALSRLGYYANAAARLAERALSNGDRVGVAVYADAVVESLPPAGGAQGLVRVRALLERLRPAASESNPLSAVLHASRLLKRRSLVVLFTELDEGVHDGQFARAMGLLVLKHLPLIAGLLDPDLVALHQQPARHWLDPYRSFAALEMLQAGRHAALRLRRMGCHVIQENPEHLDAAVLDYYRRLRGRKRL